MANNFDPMTGKPLNQPTGNTPLQGFNNFQQGYNNMPQGFNNQPQAGNNQPQQYFNNQPRNFNNQPQNFNIPPQSIPPQNIPSQNINIPPQSNSVQTNINGNVMNWSTSNQQSPNDLAYNARPANPDILLAKKKPSKAPKIALIAVASVLILGLVGGGVTFGVKAFRNNSDNKDPQVAASEPGDDTGNTVKEDSEGNETDDPSASVKTPATNTASASIEVSDMFKYVIEGNTYTVPMKVSSLIDLGWTFAEDTYNDLKLTTDETAQVDFFYPDSSMRISTTVVNYSNSALPASDCYVKVVTFFGVSVQNQGIDIKVRNGQFSAFTSSRETVLSTFGEADYKSESDSSLLLGYEEEGSNGMLYFDYKYENETPNWVKIENDDMPSNVEMAEASEKAPSYVGGYNAPSSFTASFPSKQFQLDDSTYELPVPLEVFVNNGWKYDTDPDMELSSGKQLSMAIKKNDQRVSLTITNPTDSPIIVKNSMVISVSVVKTSLSSASLEFAGGFTENITEDDIKSFISSQGITDYKMIGEHGYKLFFGDDNPENYYNFMFEDNGNLQFLTLQYVDQN